MWVPVLLACLSGALIVAGVACIYWPAALIVGGIGGLITAVTVDFDRSE
jgi:hypothetical protein